MNTIRWFQAGGPRGTPAPRRAAARRPVVLLVAAVAVLGQSGCQSGSCGPCNLFKPVTTGFQNLRSKVSHPFKSSSACCGSDLGAEAAPLQYGPSTTPSVVMPPSGGATTITPVPGDSYPPSVLDPIPPSSTIGPPPATRDSTPREGAKSQTGKATYEAYRPKSLDSSPAPTTRSAQGSGRSNAAIGESPLDNLPPIDVPGETARNVTPTPPVSPAAEAATTNPVVAAAAESTVAPGIRRFAGVESKLAGGSVPDATGLDWLVEKGYKTVLDLREEGEMTPAFITDVTRRGLRYVALPISAKTVDAEHLARFHLELSLADARPLYFFDTDGTRAGVLWYVHRVTVDKVDTQTARRDAEDLGLTDNRFWLAAQSFLNSLKPAPAPAPAAAPAPAEVKPPAPAPTPAPPADAQPKAASAAALPPSEATNSPAAPSAGPAPAVNVPTASSEPAPRDPTAWRSFAAMIVTGLGIPLAYVSRAAIPTSFRAARASLPASVRTPKSLPGASGG